MASQAELIKCLPTRKVSPNKVQKISLLMTIIFDEGSEPDALTRSVLPTKSVQTVKATKTHPKEAQTRYQFDPAMTSRNRVYFLKKRVPSWNRWPPFS